MPLTPPLPLYSSFAGDPHHVLHIFKLVTHLECLLLVERIALEVARLFEDVESEFCELDSIKAKFESWSSAQRESYDEAFIALCLPKLFAPFARLKLVDWNPLEV